MIFRKKIYSQNALKRILLKLKKSGKKIVFTNGCFDLLHTGHVSLFKKARSAGDVLVVAVNTDESIQKIKGPSRPIVGEKQRKEVLSAIEYIDYVTSFGEETPLEIIKKLRPDIIVKGSDWQYNKVVGREYARVVRVKLAKGWATTNIINKIKSLK